METFVGVKPKSNLFERFSSTAVLMKTLKFQLCDRYEYLKIATVQYCKSFEKQKFAKSKVQIKIWEYCFSKFIVHFPIVDLTQVQFFIFKPSVIVPQVKGSKMTCLSSVDEIFVEGMVHNFAQILHTIFRISHIFPRKNIQRFS